MTNPLSQSSIPRRWPVSLAALLLLICTLLAACQHAPPPPVERGQAAVPDLPDSPAWRIDPSASEVRVRIYSAGPFAVFGHNHIAVAPARGVIHAGKTTADSGFRIEVRVEEFVVDRPQDRAKEGEAFAAEISDTARGGTRDNMLGEAVLDAEDHPRILIESLRLDGAISKPRVVARVTLRGVSRDIALPATVRQDGDMLVVTAAFTVTQSAFGIEPFGILGGGLRVRDTLDVRVRLVASPVADDQ